MEMTKAERFAEIKRCYESEALEDQETPYLDVGWLISELEAAHDVLYRTACYRPAKNVTIYADPNIDEYFNRWLRENLNE